MKNLIYILLVALFAVACGDPGVDLGEVEYEPKISVEAYVFPGEDVSGIKLMRNFPLESPVDSSTVYLEPTANSVNAKISHEGATYPLTFEPLSRSWFTNDLAIGHEKSYTLEVSAVIDGKNLYCKSTTKTPKAGFSINDSDLGAREYDTDIKTSFNTSEGTTTYAFSILPDVATLDNFIYDNHYFPNIKREDLEDNGWNNFRFQYDVMINVDSYKATPFEYSIEGLDTWFYGTYTVIGYAADENFKDFLLTAKNVQQFDGNFIEPEFHFEGDGIGVFGSAVTDTLRFSVIKP